AYVGDPEPERRGGVIAISPDGSASELVRTPWMPRGATLSRRFLYTVEALPYVLPDEPAGDGSYVGVSAEIRFCRHDCSRLYETADVIVLRGESETCRWFAELAANRVGNQVLILPSRRCEEIVFMVSTGTGEILQVTYGTGVVRRIGNILDSGEDEWFLESADAFDETLFLIYRGNRSKSNSSRLVVKQLLGSVEDVFPLDSDTRAVSCLSDDTVALVERRNAQHA
ncbi:MAG TPA: hypothetical protein PKH07_14580, partial [bacterium]|nr:hypothetical protein [bacterium]